MMTNWQNISQQDFSQELLQQLSVLIREKQLLTLWLGPIWGSSNLRGLWMYVQDKAQTYALFTTAYRKNILDEEQLLIIILDTADLTYHKTIGNTLFKTSLLPSRIIYQTTAIPLPHPVSSSLANFIALYQDKHALLSSYCSDFVAPNYCGSSHALLKSLTYDIDVLETVLLGVPQTAATLTHRLLLLEQLIPKMKTLFVKREADAYYILDDLAQEIEDVPYTMWNTALQKIQKKLHRIVLFVLEQLDASPTRIPRKRKGRKQKKKPFTYQEKLAPLLRTNQVEEIYQFHEILYLHPRKQQKHVYLLVITKENPTKEIKKVIEEIEVNQEDIRFTLLAHTRFYIQEYVYEFSDFFKTIIQSKNRVYASDYYPHIHWYKSHMKNYSDFIQRYQGHLAQVNHTIQHHFKNPQGDTFITTHHLHTCLAVKLHIYILHRLHYLPQTKNIQTLVHLALYAKDTEAPKLKSLYDILHPLVFAYTVQHKQEKKYNLVLDQVTVQQLRQFFTTLEI